MAFQVDEKLLSQSAQQHLSNARSKAQFVRDAIEHYVKREEDLKEFLKLQNDIKDIKHTLENLTSVNVVEKENISENKKTLKEIETIEDDFGESVPDCYN